MADVTPYLILKDAKRPLGIDPDFCTQHKCRNFAKIQQWARLGITSLMRKTTRMTLKRHVENLDGLPRTTRRSSREAVVGSRVRD